MTENPYKAFRGSLANVWDEGYRYAVITEGRKFTSQDWTEAWNKGQEEGSHSKDDLIQALDENVDEAHRLLAQRDEVVAELLSALIRLVVFTSPHRDLQEAFALARNAIAKAKGE